MNSKVPAFARLALLMAASSGFCLAPGATKELEPYPARAPMRDPNGSSPWLAQTLPPLEVPSNERKTKAKRRSKAERKKRRRNRALRGKP